MQSHANETQIVNYRDELLIDAKVKRHIETCVECLHAVDELRRINNLLNTAPLDELSEQEFTASWQVIETSIDAPKTSAKKKPLWLAVAACTMFALLLVIQMNKPQLQQDRVLAQASQSDSLKPNINNVRQGSSELEQLVAYSRLIENRLQELPQPRIVRANTAGTISQLQDQISMLDSRLSMQHQVPLTERQQNVLWQQRVNSMNNLYRVRAAQLQRVNY